MSDDILSISREIAKKENEILKEKLKKLKLDKIIKDKKELIMIQEPYRCEEGERNIYTIKIGLAIKERFSDGDTCIKKIPKIYKRDKTSNLSEKELLKKLNKINHTSITPKED